METSRQFLKSCSCLSLRAGTIYIGILELLFYTLFFISDLVVSIVYVHSYGKNQTLKMFSTIEVLLMLHTVALNAIFDLFLLYGAIWKSPRRATYIFAWLLLKVVGFILTVLELSSDTVSLLSMGTMFSGEGFIFMLVFQIYSSFVVYNFYRTLPVTVS